MSLSNVGIEIDGVFDIVDKPFLHYLAVVHAMCYYFLGEEPWSPTTSNFLSARVLEVFIPFSTPLCKSPCSGSLQISFQAHRLPHRSQPSASKSGVSTVLQLLWRLPSLSIFWISEIELLIIVQRTHTVLRLPSNNARERKMVNIFRCPPFIGITTKETWACTISPTRNVCGSQVTNLLV